MPISEMETGGVPDANQKTPPAMREEPHDMKNIGKPRRVKKYSRWKGRNIPAPAETDPSKGRRELYQPFWLEQAAEWEAVSAGRFAELRALVHCISVEQCAALLKVEPTTIHEWEAGSQPVPFAAYMALRLLLDVRYLPDQIKAWDGWQIINAGPDTGKLYDGRSGSLVTPVEVKQLPWIKGERDAWKRLAEAAEARAAELEAENTRLRQLYQAEGITRELRDMQARLGAILDRVGTAEVIDLATVASIAKAGEKAA